MDNKARYPNIFAPGSIGRLITKNRVKYAATETNYNYGNGFVSDREVAYMKAQAKGGAGIITTQGAYPDEKGEGKGFKGMMGISDDRYIPGLAKISDVIRKNGALSCLQILHCGREGGVELDYSVMPSVVPQRLSYFKPPREMALSEIKASIRDHVEAAKRAVKAGFDMIEISGIVGYLISTFISRYTNKRQDEYNGNIKDRCRLMMEVIGNIKSGIGDATPLGIRLCGIELLDDRGGNTFEESIESFRLAEEAGADYVSVTVGWHESSISVITRDVPMGHWLYVAEAVKKVVKIPVMMAFRQFTPDIPEKAISDGIIDFWEVCRPMIADPELPKKAAEGREKEIIPCIACNLCFSRLYYHQPIMCTVRPTLGHESEPEWGYYGFATTGKRKKIIIIGGGPAGLQCASIAAEKGNEIHLFEKKGMLGGSMLLASKVDKGAVELLKPVEMLEYECRRKGVNIYMNSKPSYETLKELKADICVFAGGATMTDLFPLLKCDYLKPEDIIISGKTPEEDVLIIGGDGVGLGVGVFLLNQGDYRITIIEEGKKIGRDVNPFYLWQYVKLFKTKKAMLLSDVKLKGKEGRNILIEKNDEVKPIEAGTIIVAQREPNISMGSLNDFAKQVYYIGDAKRPRRLNNAIHDGYRLGMKL